MYDYLIVGSGLFGAVCARELTDKGKRCLVIDRRDHPAGNVYTATQDGICVHVYGAHIFHTDERALWDYVNRFAEFNNFVNSPIARYHDEVYNLPFNMNTFRQMWGIATPQQAREIIEAQRREIPGEPRNLEEQAISLIGRDLYEKLVKGYTEKQWGRRCDELPAFIIKRLPVRFTFDNNYFDDRYQGIPLEGYTALVEALLAGIETRCGVDYRDLGGPKELEGLARRTIFTGQIDEFYGFRFGALEWRSLRFETETLETDNYQGVAAVNYTDSETPFTRIIEHKHFVYGTQPQTVVSREYPLDWEKGLDAYYPVNDDRNQARFCQYAELAAQEEALVFGGRLGTYRYYDMDDAIAAALALTQQELQR
ncbi:MAG: UDP-galactopyranose mutase [Coriobacteriales bacterium]|jgi:UDP-galactopyranose mutase|nr:UDP-galactopyranose mutase [Coriobacteriales bacterium]